MKKKMSPM